MEISDLCSYFAAMYFKVSIRTNPATNKPSGYFRLVESYRNADDRVCHRTILNAGFMDDMTDAQRIEIQKILTQKASNTINQLFNDIKSEDDYVNQQVDLLFQRMVAEKRIDVLLENDLVPKRNKNTDIQSIYVSSIKNRDVKEIGAEWLCQQAINQLSIPSFLSSQGWSSDDIALANTHLISRAVYPASELETSRWIRDNSAVCEVTGFDSQEITKDKLYQISQRLYALHEPLEQFLSSKTNELFDIEDKIMLFDLTNTYFEGRMAQSAIAQFGRSKEKRSDAKLVVMGLVVNPEGFVKYSSLLKGNMADCKTLEGMITKLRAGTSLSAQKAVIVIDAGIATDENLKIITDNVYEYVCVSRSSCGDYDSSKCS